MLPMSTVRRVERVGSGAGGDGDKVDVASHDGPVLDPVLERVLEEAQ